MTQSCQVPNKRLGDLFIVLWPQVPLSLCVLISSHRYRDTTRAGTVLPLLKNTMSSSDMHHSQGIRAPFWTSCARQTHFSLCLPYPSIPFCLLGICNPQPRSKAENARRGSANFALKENSLHQGSQSWREQSFERTCPSEMKLLLYHKSSNTLMNMLIKHFFLRTFI